MKITLNIKDKLDREIIHHADDRVLISSKYRTVFFRKDGAEKKIRLPETTVKQALGWVRLCRRLLRLDKCNVFLAHENLIIVRQGNVYFYDNQNDTLTHTLKLRNCRNVLHQSINTTPEGYIYFGEYGTNKERKSVPVYCSKNGGKNWEEIYTFAPSSIKHIHGCYYDKYTDKIWVCTGDFKDENWIIIADKTFKEVQKIGDGQQQFRACSLMFTENEVHWIMDSPVEPSYQIILDRKTGKTRKGKQFEGPVWYTKRLTDGYYIVSTAQEPGDGVLDDKVHLYVTKDLKHWEEIALFEHDGLPKMYFKFGVIGFADGQQSSQNFYMFLEAIKGYDGKSILCALDVSSEA